LTARILIVDQDDALTAPLEQYLARNGFDVFRVPDGAMGMQYVLRHKPDLVVADLHCPAGGGLSILRNLRRSVMTRHIPVLIMAASSTAAMKKQLLECGLLTYIQKPFQHDDLLAEIRQLLSPGIKVIASGDYPTPTPGDSPLGGLGWY
jgi:DNA-binding response OmpR family regulator